MDAIDRDSVSSVTYWSLGAITVITRSKQALATLGINQSLKRLRTRDINYGVRKRAFPFPCFSSEASEYVSKFRGTFMSPLRYTTLALYKVLVKSFVRIQFLKTAVLKIQSGSVILRKPH